MCSEVLQYLNVKPHQTIIDCTVGEGGHAEAILARLVPGGKLIGIDQDSEALEIAQRRLSAYEDSLELVHDNFINIDTIMKERSIKSIDGVLLDLGVSSLQLDTSRRGFSIKNDGPIDMRMNPEAKLTAKDLVNILSENELSRIMKDYGEERWTPQVARAIIREREESPIVSTKQLAKVIAAAIPAGFGRRKRIHPATRVFQAFRIAVNCELVILDKTLAKIPGLLSKKGRICAISYHSLEDRIVKRRMKDFSRDNLLKIRTKKPVTPREEEVAVNPRARSAKLRVAERIG